ncbi:MAG: nitroreductase [Gammaproteobacteria bacterium]|nr:nitroreductase [Gammaproteobacteria bacterium]
MDALRALHNRNSVNLLESPGPSAEQLKNIFKAGLRACDHKNLRPWRFIQIEGDARHQLGELLLTAKTAMDGAEPDAESAAKLRAKPLRAPLVIVVAAHITEHEKVPEIEQILSAGASAQMMMVAAFAQGLGAIWRSGALMFRPEVHQGLGLADNEKIVGFLYMGKAGRAKRVPRLDPADFVRSWPE